MFLPRLYEDLADLWPLLSPPEDYAPEARCVRELIAEALGPASPGERRSLIELGAGGGHTLSHLGDDFDLVAADLSPAMLANSAALNPGIEHLVADMRTMRLGRRFDAVLIHDAVDYMTTEQDAQAAIRTAAAHLRPGGVCILAPTYTLETFEDHDIACDYRRDARREVFYTSYVRRDPAADRFTLTMTLFVRRFGRGDGGMRIIVDDHPCGLFSQANWRSWMAEAGFVVEVHSLTLPREGMDGGAVDIAAFVGVLR